MATDTLRVEKANIGNAKLIPVAPDEILRSYEAKRSVCARMIYNIITYNPEPQANELEFVRSCLVHERIILSKRFFWMNYFTKSDRSIWNSLRLEQHRSTSSSTSQNSLSDAWQSLRLETSQNSGVYDPMMNEPFQRFNYSNSHWTEERVGLELKTDGPLIWACVNWTLESWGEIKVFMVSHCLCKKVSWWRLVYSLYMQNINVSHHY